LQAPQSGTTLRSQECSEGPPPRLEVRCRARRAKTASVARSAWAQLLHHQNRTKGRWGPLIVPPEPDQNGGGALARSREGRRRGVGVGRGGPGREGGSACAAPELCPRPASDFVLHGRLLRLLALPLALFAVVAVRHVHPAVKADLHLLQARRPHRSLPHR